MFSPFTLEDRLLLACARTEPDLHKIEDLVERGPDWSTIVRKAERSGLVFLVQAGLRQAGVSDRMPKPFSERLKHLYRRDVIRSIILREPLRAIFLRFLEAGVSVIVLKGTALAAVAYPSPSMRPVDGVDLLVRTRDFDTVDKLLRSMRYAPSAPVIPGSGPEGNHPIRYHAPEPFPPLELCHHIGTPGNSSDLRFPIEEVWKRARPFRIESVDTLVLGHEDLLVQLALQLLEQRFTGHVRTLCDIAEMCKRSRSKIDWHILATRAEAYKLGKPLYYALRLARDLLDAAVPGTALTELRGTFRQLPLEDKFISSVSPQALLSEGEAQDLKRSLYYEVSGDLLGARHARDEVLTAGHLLAGLCHARLRQIQDLSHQQLECLDNSSTSGVGLRGQAAAPSPSLKPTHDSRRSSVRNGVLMRAPGEVAVTYDQDGASDGVGAQLQRIYGLYALARALHVKYVHTPLGQVLYQGLMPLLAGRTDPEFAARYNSFFSLPSDPFQLESCERVRVHYVDQDTIEHHRERSAKTGHPVLLQGLLPYRYTDRHPEVYRVLHQVSPYRGYRAAGPVRICIHLRRGDNSLSGRSDRRQRWLPNAYYLRACSPVVEALRQQGVPFIMRLHSEMPAHRYTLDPQTPGLYVKLEQPGTIDPAQYALEEFEALPNLETVLNVEAKEALDDFGTADVLVLSLSSLSYLGGMLNPHGLVIYAPWFHVPLPGWLVADEHGNLDEAQVASSVADLLRKRGN